MLTGENRIVLGHDFFLSIWHGIISTVGSIIMSKCKYHGLIIYYNMWTQKWGRPPTQTPGHRHRNPPISRYKDTLIYIHI